MSRFTDMLVRDSGKHFLSVSAFAEPASFVPAEQGGDGAGFACTVAVGDDAGSPQDRRSAGLRLDVHQPVFAASIAELRAGIFAATGVARDPGPRDLIMLPATSAMAGVYAVESCAPDLGGMCRITTARAEALAVRSVPQAT